MDAAPDRLDELWPEPALDLDIAARIARDEREGPDGRPWVTMIMIASLDGGISIDGVSGGLGGPPDQRRFIAARRQMDAIVVGATTVRVEDYRPTSVPIAVITGSLSLDPAARLFSDTERQPLLFTTTESAQDRGDRYLGIAEVIDLGDSIQPAAVLADLARRGVRTVALEGGPSLNGQFLSADLVDELLLTISPLAVGGNSPRLAHGTGLGDNHGFTLDRISRAGDMVFARYLRTRT